MSSIVSEKASLVEQAPLVSWVDVEAYREEEQQECRRLEVIEYLLLFCVLVFTSIQFLVLYYYDGAPASEMTHCEAMLATLASNWHLTIPASLPTSGVLFIIAPYVARPERVPIVRYIILLCYLVGSMVGGLLI
jgi:hypothetical protein